MAYQIRFIMWRIVGHIFLQQPWWKLPFLMYRYQYSAKIKKYTYSLSNCLRDCVLKCKKTIIILPMRNVCSHFFNTILVLAYQVQTRYLNPDNLSLDADGYFTNSEVLQRVPSVFLLLGDELWRILWLTQPKTCTAWANWASNFSYSPIKIYFIEFFLRRAVFLSVSNRFDDARHQCCGIENISFGKIRIAALAPVLAPAPDSFKRCILKIRYLLWLSNRIKIVTIFKNFFSNRELLLQDFF